MRCWLALLACLALPAHAQSLPQPGEGDPRIQSVIYDPARIIRLEVGPGVQTLVELAAGEAIQTIGVGDSSAWQVTAGKRGDILFVKNVGASATTNMSVVTAARVYHFELAPPGGYGDASPYHVKILFPPRARPGAGADDDPQYEYRVSGARSIRPSDVYQEGDRTILEWPEKAALPGIFIVQDGQEALVNGIFEDGRLVVPGTPAKFIFRLDRKLATATRKWAKAPRDE